MYFMRRTARGMTFMDVIIGTALILVIFTALVGLLRSSLRITSLAKSRSVATAAAEGQIEYIRSLSYDNVGTIGGIPAGPIPQYATTTQDGVTLVTRTFISYTDDPADGLGTNDSNGIMTDYKTIKVSVTYTSNGTPEEVDLLSAYAPPGLETTTGGGTLKIVVVNALGVAVPGASVRIQDASTSPTINLTTFSDSDGLVFLPGAPTSTQYQVLVTKNGYSSAQTYTRDSTNQNPTPGFLTVVKDQTTTATFAIDLLSTLNISTFSPIATSTWNDAFSNSSQMASMTNTTVSGGNIQLVSSSGSYVPSGSARSTSIGPTYLYGWSSASMSSVLPGGTTAVFHVTDGSGTLLPDTTLPGNATGFTAAVDLSNISTTTYPSLGLSADLTTSSTSTTPLIQSWSITYLQGPVPLPNIDFTLTGAKAIGTTGGGVPIIKTTVATSTGATATQSLSLEWDTYNLTLPNYDVVDACNAPPYVLSPGTTLSSTLVLSTSTANMMLVSVRDAAGPVANASVALTHSGVTKTVLTDSCGSAYFGSLSSTNYDISISKSGYTTFNATAVPISGHIFYAATLD